MIDTLGCFCQVAPDWGFDSLEFLSQTCVRASLPPGGWLDEDTMVEHFQAQIFAEVAPGRELPGGVGGDMRDLRMDGAAPQPPLRLILKSKTF